MNLLTSNNTNTNGKSSSAATSSSSNFKKMTQKFTLLTQQRRNFDLVLSQVRTDLAGIESSLKNLANVKNNNNITTTNSSSSTTGVSEEQIVILSAEVDCQRRTLDALSRLFDEKQVLLERHRDEHQRDVKTLKNIFLSSSSDSSFTLNEKIEELRQTEQRIRDLEDALLANDDEDENENDFILNEQQVAERQKQREEEKYLRNLISETENDMKKLDEKLRAVIAEKSGISSSSNSSETAQKLEQKQKKRIESLLQKKALLKSKLDQRRQTVNRLSSEADHFGLDSRSIILNNNQNSSKFNNKNNNNFNNNHHLDDSLSASLRSYNDAHRLLSLVKSSACQLRHDFDEISSVITRYSLEKTMILQKIQQEREEIAENAKKMTASAKKRREIVEQTPTETSLEMWTQDEFYKILTEIQKLFVNVLERQHLIEEEADDEEDEEDVIFSDDDEGDDDEMSDEDDNDSETRSQASTSVSVSKKHPASKKNKKKNKKKRTLKNTSSSTLRGLEQLLKSIRKLTVLIDVIEPSLGKRSVFEQLRIADDEFNLLPQLYQITKTALEVEEEINHDINTSVNNSSNNMLLSPSSSRVVAANRSPRTRLF